MKNEMHVKSRYWRTLACVTAALWIMSICGSAHRAEPAPMVVQRYIYRDTITDIAIRGHQVIMARWGRRDLTRYRGVLLMPKGGHLRATVIGPPGAQEVFASAVDHMSCGGSWRKTSRSVRPVGLMSFYKSARCGRWIVQSNAKTVFEQVEVTAASLEFVDRI
jgi:hypothetical protein